MKISPLKFTTLHSTLLSSPCPLNGIDIFDPIFSSLFFSSLSSPFSRLFLLLLLLLIQHVSNPIEPKEIGRVCFLSSFSIFPPPFLHSLACFSFLFSISPAAFRLTPITPNALRDPHPVSPTLILPPPLSCARTHARSHDSKGSQCIYLFLASM